MTMRLFSAVKVSAIIGLGLAVHTIAAAAADDGFQSIFNGKDLTGWDGNPKFWSVEDGAITGRTTRENPTPGNTFIIWRGGTVSDFELRLLYRIVPGDDRGFGNSGIQYRSKDFGNWSVGGYQADIEAGDHYSGILYEERMSRGIMAERGEKVVWTADGKKQVVGKTGDPKAIQDAIRKGDWNEYVVIAQGNHLVHKINGHVTVDVTDNDPQKQARSGILALQLHAGPPMTVQFKDIRLKHLTAARKIVLVAGGPSHGPGDHEHRAGCLLLARCLESVPGITTVVVSNGWPADVSVFNDAAAIAVFSDGGGGHPFVQGDRLKVIGDLMAKGVGLGCIHYAVEVPKDRGGKEFLSWIGGYFETDWSVNPFWEAEFKTFPDHPVTRGVKPFKAYDEWYYHMRFQEGMKGVTPILSALPPAETLNRPDGPHSNNPHVRKAVLENKEPQHVMWVYERPDGGRGFGFTGGHAHKLWGGPDYRKVVLNALLWIAKVDVPPDGVECSPTPEELKVNLDPKGR